MLSKKVETLEAKAIAMRDEHMAAMQSLKERHVRELEDAAERLAQRTQELETKALEARD